MAGVGSRSGWLILNSAGVLVGWCNENENNYLYGTFSCYMTAIYIYDGLIIGYRLRAGQEYVMSRIQYENDS